MGVVGVRDSLTVPETQEVESYHAMITREVRQEVPVAVRVAAEPMNQHDRRSGALIDVVDLRAVNIDDIAGFRDIQPVQLLAFAEQITPEGEGGNEDGSEGDPKPAHRYFSFRTQRNRAALASNNTAMYSRGERTYGPGAATSRVTLFCGRKVMANRMKAVTAVLNPMHEIEIITQLGGARLEQFGELVLAATQLDGHEPVGEHKFLRMQHGDDLAMGMLAREDDRLVGYAHTLTFSDDAERRMSCEMVVHPDVRRRGIGERLMANVIEHAKSQGAQRLDVWAYNDSAVSRHFAENFGFIAGRQLMHMHRHPGEPPYLAAPDGSAIRAFRPGVDEAVLLRLNNRIFREHPENGHWTMEDLVGRMRQPWFHADDVLMLEVAGRLAGFCWLKVEERGQDGRVGEVYVIGTAQEYQGLGLGRYLLSRALSHLHERGVDAVAVYVDQSNARGVALYWSLDFHHHHVDVCYTLPLGETGVTGMPASASGATAGA